MVIAKQSNFEIQCFTFHSFWNKNNFKSEQDQLSYPAVFIRFSLDRLNQPQHRREEQKNENRFG